MKKGIIFTTDAILALIAVIVLLAMIPMQAGNSESKVFENLNDRARDEAITSFYKGTTGSNTSIEGTSMFGKCVIYYSLDPNNGLGAQAQPQKKVFCEEA
ncbi:MAG: hypothetical protein WC634_04590 [archaeon]